MIYSKLTILKNRLKAPRKDFAEILGVTVTGLDTKLKNETFTVKDIEIIANHFNVPISYFFEEKAYSTVSEPSESYRSCMDCAKKEGIIETLTDLLKQKEDQIAQLNRELGGRTPSKQANAR